MEKNSRSVLTKPIRKKNDLASSFDFLKIGTFVLDVPTLQTSTAETITTTVLKTVEHNGMNLSDCLSVVTDNCNTMAGKKNGVRVCLQSAGMPLLDIGGCSLHHVHNACKKAVDSLNSGVEQLVGDLFCLFRYSGPINRKYEALAEILDFEPLKFVRHVETQWLQLLLVVQVVLKQYDLLIQFFQENSENLPMEKDRVQRIMTALRNPQTKATLLMLEDTLRPMEQFEKLFQRRNVQIHKLWNEMNQLLKSFLLRFIEKTAIKSPSFRTEFTKRENWVFNGKILFGEATAAEVARMTEEDRQMFFANACRFLESAAAALLHYLPFQNEVLRFCRLLNPQK